MIKREELTNPSSCMSRAEDDEMTFVLLGRDPAAPMAIRAWVQERIRIGKNTFGDSQIREAIECGRQMELARADEIEKAHLMAAPSPSVPSGPVERTLDDADTDAALKAVESMLPPASKPERSGTCPTCKSTDPKVRLKGLAWAANLLPERGCVIRCEDRTCRSVVPHFHAYCSNSFHKEGAEAPLACPDCGIRWEALCKVLKP